MPNKNDTFPTVSEQTLQIQAFLEQQPIGAYLSYAEIAEGTGVPMDARGKEFLRSALERAGLERLTFIGEGIELASPTNFQAISKGQLSRVMNAARRGEEMTLNMTTALQTELTPDQRTQLLMQNAVFGAISGTASAQNKALVNQERPLTVALPGVPTMPQNR